MSQTSPTSREAREPRSRCSRNPATIMENTYMSMSDHFPRVSSTQKSVARRAGRRGTQNVTTINAILM